MSFTGPVRRVVTGHDADGRAIIVADGPSARIYDDLGEEGLVFQESRHTTERYVRAATTNDGAIGRT